MWHALRSALVPVLTQFGVDLGALLSGAVLTEQVFTLPGVARAAVLAVTRSDLPVIMGVTLLGAAGMVGASIVVDICYGLLDPRVRGR